MEKRIYVIFLAAVLCAVSCSRPERLGLLSFNVRYVNQQDTGVLSWDSRKAAAVCLVRDIAPDIIGFQEPKAPQVAFLTESLPGYGHVELGRDAGVKPDGGEHLMIMYRNDKYELLDQGHFWMSETPDSVSFGWDAMCRRITVWVHLAEKGSGRDFYFFDTHFDHVGVEARRNEAIILARMMRDIAGDGTPVFVCGDFNMDISDTSMKPIMEWMSEACQEAPDTDTRQTFNGFGIDVRPLRIDHVFYRNADPVSFRVVTDDYGVEYVSDHYPVYAVFEL